MKRTLLLAALATSLSAFGQGVVNFNNRVAADINGPLVDAPFTNGLTGLRIDGSVTDPNGPFLAALYGVAGAGQLASSMTMLVNGSTGQSVVGFRTGAARGYVNVGAEGARTIPGAAYGSQVSVQIRVWQSQFASYETATGWKGTSGIVTMGTTTGPTDQAIPRMVGLPGFAIVPEPSCIALGLLGLCALTLFRCRK